MVALAVLVPEVETEAEGPTSTLTGSTVITAKLAAREGQAVKEVQQALADRTVMVE